MKTPEKIFHLLDEISYRRNGMDASIQALQKIIEQEGDVVFATALAFWMGVNRQYQTSLEGKCMK